MQERLAFLDFTPQDGERLRTLRPYFIERREQFLDAFYSHLLTFPGTSRLLKDPATVSRARAAQAAYFERLLEGSYDDAFCETSILIGLRHHEIGLEPKWVVGAYNMYLSYWTERILEACGDRMQEVIGCIQALHKSILLATSLTVDAYYIKTLERIQGVVANQHAAILELSTPVIQIYDGILVLPLIGTIDSARTRQIMENLLARVVETQSEVVILDLTGVSVVDTAVANHLMKTVQAAELLGTSCLLTGISPAIAQTLVHLGVDLGQIATCATLKMGLAHAFARLGLAVRKVEG
jgi:rsbT co-antagonist protein RsbR